MDKRTFLVKALGRLEDDWLPAGGLKIIAQEGRLSDEMIDNFVDIIQLGIEEAKDHQTKEKLSKSVEVIEKVKKLEKQSKQQDKEDLDELEDMLKDL